MNSSFAAPPPMPITSSPAWRARSTSALPVPPAAPWISTDWPLLEGDAIVKQVIGDLVIGERRRLIHIGAVGQRIDRDFGRRVVFGIAAAAMRPVAGRDHDALARAQPRHAGPDRARSMPLISVPGVPGKGGIQL